MELLRVVLVADLLVAAHAVEDAQGDGGRGRRRWRQTVLNEDRASCHGLGADLGPGERVADAKRAAVRGGLVGDDGGDVEVERGGGVGSRIWVLLLESGGGGIGGLGSGSR